ncbi:MAG: transcriptional regulator [Saprospiraceae bacterium]
MAMKHKLISTRSNEILTYFSQNDRDYFDFAEATIALPNSSTSALKELLSDMVKRGLLMRLRKGLYYRIPYEQDADSFMPDWHLIAEPLTKGAEHYIGYYSALQIHNLITQPSLREQIVVSRQFKPSKLQIKKTTFQFIYHNEKHFFGSKKIWIDNFNKVKCSDLEKTIVDCLFKPDYAGGIVEISRAIYSAKEKLDFDKLYEYACRFKSQAVIKRMGFLLELLEIESGITKKLRKEITKSYVRLDTELPESGKLNSRWSIQQNLELETIKSALYT